MQRYSIYEAKAKLSAIIRAVKNRQRVCITERGRDVAWVVPSPSGHGPLEERIEALTAAGVVVGGTTQEPGAVIAPIARVEGGLQRFLEGREDE